MTTFGAHFVKEVSRAQLSSTAKVLLPSAHEKETGRGRKSSFHNITGPTFLDHNIVLVYKGATLSNLSRGDVHRDKVGTF